jgi:hypothetical protein
LPILLFAGTAVATIGVVIWMRLAEGGRSIERVSRPPKQYATFHTAGTAEFHGLKIVLEYPAAFISEPVSAPFSGRQFRFDNKPGRDVIAVTVANTPSALSAADALVLLRDPRAQQAIAPGSRNWKVQAVDGLTFPCAVLDYDFDVPDTPSLSSQCRNYVFLVDNRMLHILFMRIAPTSSRALDEWSDLIEHVVHSVKKT